MFALRSIRRFSTAPCKLSPSASNSTKGLKNPAKTDEPALIKLKKEKDPDRLFDLFRANASNRLVVENRFAFEDTVSRLSGAGRLDYIESLLEEQKYLPQGRREGFIIRIIMLYGKTGMVGHAVQTFHDMHLHRCKRTVKSFNATLKVLTQSRDLKAISLFLNDVPVKFGIQLDVYSINIVIKAFCEMGILDKAIQVMVEMEKLGIFPDVFTYTTLISAFYEARRVEIANGLWNLMLLKGCHPNVATFNVRIQFLINQGRAWEANKMLNIMRRHRKFPEFPDEITYNLVIKGFFQVGYYDKAMRVYSIFHDDGYKPNQRIYQTMIHYLCMEGKYDLAYLMCKDCMQKNWFPSVHTVYNLLRGLRKAGEAAGGDDMIDKAKNIYSLALTKRPPFSVVVPEHSCMHAQAAGVIIYALSVSVILWGFYCELKFRRINESSNYADCSLNIKEDLLVVIFVRVTKSSGKRCKDCRRKPRKGDGEESIYT
ncbi:Pentatricopeptide repeat-containing protein -mitochondrial [Striga hermonthica]|uniref:Pentatricopeptide repeat-containing protein -mitochondrial n=1 Tax=Striga hermonthica TaxID=68872 RepID=A0A9N7NA34_STRHE|nr:Pentatricopeptide repeat-containing protein -mitochondrial [Striga hermonthica]